MRVKQGATQRAVTVIAVGQRTKSKAGKVQGRLL